MLKRSTLWHTSLEFVSLKQMVPADHLLRNIERVIGISFVHNRVAGCSAKIWATRTLIVFVAHYAGLYCPDNGRLSLNPTLMFKALFIGDLLGRRSQRQLLREIEVDLAYRCFVGLSLINIVPDALSPSQSRRLSTAD
jgi:hypothetical protein